MSSIPEKVRAAADDADREQLRAAVQAVLDKAAAWTAAGMPMSAIGDELLLTIGPALGVPLKMGQFAQLVEVVDDTPPCGHSTLAQYAPRCCTLECPNYAGGSAR